MGIITPTGMRINGVPQMAVQLVVQVDGRAPYQATTKILLGGTVASFVRPGASVPVRVDPNDP